MQPRRTHVALERPPRRRGPRTGRCCCAARRAAPAARRRRRGRSAAPRRRRGARTSAGCSCRRRAARPAQSPARCCRRRRCCCCCRCCHRCRRRHCCCRRAPGVFCNVRIWVRGCVREGRALFCAAPRTQPQHRCVLACGARTHIRERAQHLRCFLIAREEPVRGAARTITALLRAARAQSAAPPSVSAADARARPRNIRRAAAPIASYTTWIDQPNRCIASSPLRWPRR